MHTSLAFRNLGSSANVPAVKLAVMVAPLLLAVGLTLRLSSLLLAGLGDLRSMTLQPMLWGSPLFLHIKKGRLLLLVGDGVWCCKQHVAHCAMHLVLSQRIKHRALTPTQETLRKIDGTECSIVLCHTQ